jgi:Velvet factor
MCGVGGMSLPMFFFVVLYFVFFFSVFLFYFVGVENAMDWGRSLAGSRSSTNRPSAHRATARHRQGSQKPAIAVPLAAPALLASAARVAHPCSTAHPRLFRNLGHVHAHPKRLRWRPFPAESVLLYVCQSGQARRRHGVALDEGASLLPHTCPFVLLSLRPACLAPLIHIMLSPQDGKTRCTTGSVVSSLYHLKDSENDNRDAGFFVFPDLSVRQEGSYRLKLSLFEVVGCVPTLSFVFSLSSHRSSPPPLV